jgi:hypothetical protein
MLSSRCRRFCLGGITLPRLLGVLALAGTVVMAQPARAQTLTGATLFSTNASGGFNGFNAWDTNNGNATYALWVSLNGVPLNGPTDATVALNSSLSVPGTYEFAIYANPGGNQAFHGLNLFFEGNSTNPGISIYAPLATTAATPGFSSNAANTYSLAGTTVPGSGSQTYTSGTTQIVLTDFRWESSNYQGQDIVSPFTRTPGSGADNQGRFTLVVSSTAPNVAAPEPGTFPLLLVGTVGMVGIVLRKRNH